VIKCVNGDDNYQSPESTATKEEMTQLFPAFEITFMDETRPKDYIKMY